MRPFSFKGQDAWSVTGDAGRDPAHGPYDGLPRSTARVQLRSETRAVSGPASSTAISLPRSNGAFSPPHWYAIAQLGRDKPVPRASLRRSSNCYNNSRQQRVNVLLAPQEQLCHGEMKFVRVPQPKKYAADFFLPISPTPRCRRSASSSGATLSLLCSEWSSCPAINAGSGSYSRSSSERGHSRG